MKSEGGFEIYEKVPAGGPEWTTRRENEALRELEPAEKIFGHSFLREWQFLNKEGEEWEAFAANPAGQRYLSQRIAAREKAYKRTLEEFTRELTDLANRHPDKLEIFFEAYAERAAAFERPEQTESEAKKEATGKIINSYKKGVPGAGPDFLAGILKQRELEIKTAKEALKPEFETYREKLIAELTAASKEGARSDSETRREPRPDSGRQAAERKQIPVSAEIVKERLLNLRIVFVDEIAVDLKEAWGDYAKLANTVRISTRVPRAERWRVFVHEALHAVSGQVEVAAESAGSNNHNFVFHDQIKFGLHFDKADRPGPSYLSLWWLNEAVTQNLTDRFAGQGKESVEQKLAALLVSKGVPAELFEAAYFENYEAKPRGEHRLPQTKRLFEAADKIFGQGFLMQLDHYLRMKSRGVDKKDRKYVIASIILEWQDRGDQFPQMVRALSEFDFEGLRSRRQDKRRK